MMTTASRLLLWIVCEHYFDDFNTTEPTFAFKSGQRYLNELFELAGWAFAPSKHMVMALCRKYLGVVTSFGQLHSRHVISLGVDHARRIHMIDTIDAVLASGWMPPAQASMIGGKTRFCISPIFGRVGRAALAELVDHEHGNSSEVGTGVRHALEFLRLVLLYIPDAEVPLLPDGRRPVIILSDASGSRRTFTRRPSGHLGFVLLYPVVYSDGRLGHQVYHSDTAVPPALQELLDHLYRDKPREVYISAYEGVAMLAPYFTLPHLIAGMPVLHYIDNAGVLCASIKAYSRAPDLARIVSLFWLRIAQLRCIPWLDYVPSESNMGDVPSRWVPGAPRTADDVPLWSLGTYVPMVLPPLSNLHGGWASLEQMADAIFVQRRGH